MASINFAHPRDQIVAFMQRIYDYGMTTTSGGNLSIMDSTGNMWISPAGVDKGTLTRDDIVCVKADGTIEGRHRPSSEYPFHRSIYKMRPDVKAILHAHPPMLVSFSVAGKVPNTEVFATAKGICGSVGFAPYEVPGSEALGKNVGAAFAAGHSTILLENHGACCAGSTLLEAFQRFETLDFCARAINGALRLGEPKYLSDTDLEFSHVNRNVNLTPFTPDSHTSDELELRRQMELMVRRSYRQQLFTSTEGTVAVRVDKDSFLITPSGVDRGTVCAEDFVLIHGNCYESGKVPSTATWFFQKLFDAQPEVNALFIANPPNLMAYAVSHETFDPRVIPESYILLREMPAFPFGTQYRNVEEITKVVSPRYPIVIIQNDCILSSGKTLLEAFDRMEVAEYSAKATISAGCLGGMNPINQAQIDDLVKAFKLIP